MGALEDVINNVASKAEPMLSDQVKDPAVAAAVAAAPKVETPKKPVTEAPKTDPIKEENEKLKARVAELEGKTSEISKKETDLASIQEARELWKSGKRMEAIGKLAGVDDPTGELEEMLKSYVSLPDKGAADAGIKPEDVDKRIAAALAERDAKAEEDQKKRDEEEKTRRANELKESTRLYCDSVLSKHKDSFDLCMRDGNRQEAADAAGIVALEFLKKDAKAAGVEFEVFQKNMTAEQAESAVVRAYERIEAQLEETGKANYLKAEKGAKPAERKQETVTPPDRGAPKAAVKVSTSDKPWQIENVLNKAIQNARY